MRHLLVALLISLPLTSFAEEKVRTVVTGPEVDSSITYALVRHLDTYVDCHNHGLRYRYHINLGNNPVKLSFEGPLMRSEKDFGLMITIHY
jgi:hypothetical protein